MPTGATQLTITGLASQKHQSPSCLAILGNARYCSTETLGLGEPYTYPFPSPPA